MSFEVSLDGDKRIIGKLDEMISIPSNPKSLLKEAGELVIEDTKKTFDTEGSNLDGAKWKRLSPNTVRQRVRLGYGAGPILQRTGRLKRSFFQVITSKQTTITSNSPYYGFHQKGGSIIPKRKMLGLNDKTKTAIVKVFANEYRKTIRK
jgi:phage gpG-like protein